MDNVRMLGSSAIKGNAVVRSLVGGDALQMLAAKGRYVSAVVAAERRTA